MIENADDDPVETKPIFVDNSEDVTPPRVEAFFDVRLKIILKLPSKLNLLNLKPSCNFNETSN